MHAIILCAGMSQRFRPVSYAIPKPLVPIEGVPLVERSIAMLHDSGITDITIITGYLDEKYEYLKEKHHIELVYNDRYAECNNWTSLFMVRDRLDDALIIDGDLVFLENFVSLVQSGKSQFISQPTRHGLEWQMLLNAECRIEAIHKWKPDGYGLVGLSYWQGEAARMLAEELEQCTPEDYWEDAAIRIIEKTPVYATCVERTFLYELDTLKDALHFHLLTHEEIAHLSSHDYKPQKLKGLTNNTWKIRGHDGAMWCLRIPGAGTEAFIDREQEPVVISFIENLGVTPSTVFYPHGLKTCTFLEGYRIATAEDMTRPFFDALASLLKRLHSVPFPASCPFPPMYLKSQIELYEAQSGILAEPELRDWLMEKAAFFDASAPVLCHRDLLLENILFQEGEYSTTQLIDFEYAGFTHPLWDSASFILEADLADAPRKQFIESMKLDEDGAAHLLWMEILVDYVWGMWGLVNRYADYAENRLKRSRLKFYALKRAGSG